MKKLIFMLVLAPWFFQAQNNVALFHTTNSGEAKFDKEHPEFTVAPFELLEGMIVVQAQVNGETGSFILDTGSPAMVVDNERNPKENGVAMGVGGKMRIGKTELRDFSFGNIHKKDLEGYVLDISQLEQACGRDLMGLIGYDVLKQYELQFDYSKKIILIYPASEAGRYHASKPVKTIPFALSEHVPVITVRVGGRKAYFGIDSGAAVNLLDTDYLGKLGDSVLSNVNEEWLVGLDNTRQLVVGANVGDCKIKGNCFPSMRYLFTDMSKMEDQLGSRLDGLLGFPFFKGQNIAINYKKRKIYLW
ncbi:MAG: aspartyl protease family protein [Saprospiraceae bacterium]